MESMQGTATRVHVKQGSKPRKRVLTAARKEQNRVAQRVYRQRQREHLISERNKSQLTLRPCVTLRPKTDLTTAATNGAQLSSNNLVPTTEETLATSHIDASAVILKEHESLQPNSSYDVVSAETNNAVPNLEPPDGCTLALLEGGTSFDANRSSKYAAWMTPPEEPLDYIDGHLGDLHSITCPSDTALLGMQPVSSVDFLETLNYATQSRDLERGQLELPGTVLFSAILENAICLGFDLEKLGSCQYSYTSPFYEANVTSQSEPSEVIASCLATLSSRTSLDIHRLPANLYPTLAQVLIPHHASLDLIPIPALRESVIMLSAAMPQKFNLLEFKIDVHKHGGLEIWRRDPSTRLPWQASINNTSYQPWDVTSWVAAPWFLKKWRMAVGGDDSDLAKESRLWQAQQRQLSS